MRNVMVVDDDYLVRQGFIRIMPWERFGMAVTCEASNGLEALELLEKHTVDLLITDLAMPVMTGLELMKQVKVRYPRIHMVVLTFHHEFELIRDALRLGALDYITKLELEGDQMESILQRIVSRIDDQQLPVNTQSQAHMDSAMEQDAICTVSRLLPQEKELVWTIIEGKDVNELQKEAWQGATEQKDKHALDQVYVMWQGVKGLQKEQLLGRLRMDGERLMFYEFQAGKHYYELPVDCLQDVQQVSKEDVTQLGVSWSQLSWITDKELFERLLEQTAAIRLPLGQLEQMLYIAMEEWSKYFDRSIIGFDEQRKPQIWQEWVNWLEMMRQRMQQEGGGLPYSEEVVASIMKAVDYVKQELKHDIQLPDIARRVCMSRSYFSRCFRDIVGTTFQDFVRDIRVEHAKTLLSQTNRSISWIASQSGYPNERYFGKVFRQTTGLLPRDYRKAGQKSHK